MSEHKSVTVVSGTNRPESHTAVLARFVVGHLQRKGVEAHLVDLLEVNPGMLSVEMYGETGQSPEVKKIQDRCFVSQDRFIFLAPEYNGSIPGVLKVFIDALSVREYDSSFFHKKACLIGVASGRAGNLRGLDHLSDILSYLGVIVFPEKLPVSRVFEFVEGGELTDEEVRKTIAKLVDDFLKF